MQKLNILLFCNRPASQDDARTIIDHIDAFKKYSSHNIIIFSNTGYYPPKINLNEFDVIVIHYSCYLLGNRYISDSGKESIRQFKGLKIAFLQDEYRRINEFHEMINYLGINVLFTCVPENEIEKVYPKAKLPNVIKINNLTGYISEDLLGLSCTPITERPIDVGYRARKLAFWYGKLGAEKWQIVDKFLAHVPSDLICDLSYDEGKRIYGAKWFAFIRSCKTMLGVESGASVFDFTGEIEKTVEKYQAENPNASFEEVYEQFLKNIDGKIYLNQISPRCFEAIALRTPLILFEGNYSNILKPWDHYIPLKKDFSNFDEVVGAIKNSSFLEQLAERAYQDIAASQKYSYKTFIHQVDTVIDKEFALHGRAPLGTLYLQSTLEKYKADIPAVEKLKRLSARVSYRIYRKLPYNTGMKLKLVVLPYLRKLNII